MDDETKLKAEAWDIVYPTLVFLIKTGILSNMVMDDLQRSVKHIQDEDKKE